MLDAIPVNAAFKTALSNDIVAGVVVCGEISCHGQSNLLRIEANFNRKRYAREVLQLVVVPFLQGIPGAIFQ